MSVIMHHKADGAEVSVSLPHLSAGEQLYVTNIGKRDLEVLPQSHGPIHPGESRLFERHSSGVGIMVTTVTEVPPANWPPKKSLPTMSISPAELKKAIEEYLLTFGDNGVENERWLTPRGYAESELTEFLEWLERRADQPAAE